MKGLIRAMGVAFGMISAACSASTHGQPVQEATLQPAPVTPTDTELWRQQKPGLSAPGRVEFPAPEVFTLDNGLKVYVVPRAAGLVRLRYVSQHGQSSVSDAQSGLAALTARMLTEGTRKRSGLQLAEAAETLGSTLDGWADRDSSSIQISTFPAQLDGALELLADVVMQPRFASADFERVRGEWLDTLRSERQDPERLASLAGLRVLNGGTFGAPVTGALSSVARLKLEDLRAFHANAYQPASSALFLVGEVSTRDVRDTIVKRFGAWHAGSKPIQPVNAVLPPPPPEHRVVLIPRPGAVQTAVFVGQRFPKRAAPGYELRQVMSNVVGGLFTSRINRNLREKNGYTYGASGRPIATRDWGAFVVRTSVRTDVTAEALTQILAELRQARDPDLGAPFLDDEVERAKADLLHSIGATLEQTARVLDASVELFVQQLPQTYLAQYPSIVSNITLPMVQHDALELTPQQVVIVLVGDEKSVRPALEASGFVVDLAPDTLSD